jgi:DNA-binding NtrC family response regulator
VLESGGVQRLGGASLIQVDVRVLAATHRDLWEEAHSGRFREDLLFRLEVVPIRMPPLRERLEDLPLLVEHAGKRLRARHGLVPPDLSEDAMEALSRHPWPGNVRELLNLLERLAILHRGGRVDAGGVSEFLRMTGRAVAPTYADGDRRTLMQRLDDYEADLIRGALLATGGSMTRAAGKLQTDRANLYRRIKRLGLQDVE